ncbi:tyrosine-tRNA ligase [Radiomyces spectabilis]|uniref:tyrosine-tRNA ligase n=1 Tax=Radiomyces spectabilis TaxID=64574 RepID=UPI00221E9F9F|nr:tyrosine-tRNA ligase [Radiomyces spectabilis]KAI8376135.1 tyrosine-tRNA ligase [Radiomyces spectabilis]
MWIRSRHSIQRVAHCFSKRCYSSEAPSNVVSDMTRRGLVANTTSPNVVEMTNKPTTIYCGVDPTAKSLHLGNLVTLMGLFHFHIRGHQTIALVGGATGSIGDPSGRQSERVPLTRDVLSQNIAGIEKQVHRFFANGAAYAERRGFNYETRTPKVLNNYDWFSNMTALEFLGDVGRYARVNTMLAKESVKSRIESTQGISFTEFSYQLLQAYDFWYLYQNHHCRIQLGGSDQWGNITAGIDLIGRRRDAVSEPNKEDHAKDAYGITIPLLLTSTGEKFGKSAGNAVWLDETMTSIYDFYQFFIKTTDADVGKLLGMFTLYKEHDIKEILHEHAKNPEKRLAQQALANETTELVHGLDGVQQAQTATKVLFGEDLGALNGQTIVNAFKHDRSRFTTLERAQVIGQGLDTIATLANATKSKSEAQKRIKAGGMYLNNIRVSDPRHKVEPTDLIDGQVCVLRLGKSSYHLVHVI